MIQSHVTRSQWQVRKPALTGSHSGESNRRHPGSETLLHIAPTLYGFVADISQPACLCLSCECLVLFRLPSNRMSHTASARRMGAAVPEDWSCYWLALPLLQLTQGNSCLVAWLRTHNTLSPCFSITQRLLNKVESRTIGSTSRRYGCGCGGGEAVESGEDKVELKSSGARSLSDPGSRSR